MDRLGSSVPKNALAPDDGSGGNPLLNALSSYWQQLNDRARSLPAFNPVQNGQLSPYAQSVVGNMLGFVGGTDMAPANRLIAYHGSPHSFDTFDASKIGTGEGAQAYGHGLYFAENEGVARSYRDALAAKAPVAMPSSSPGEILLRNGIQDARMRGATPSDRMAALKQWLDETEGMSKGKYAPQGMSESVVEARRLLSTGKIVPDFTTPPGSMYQVGINANPDHMLDWDRPISEQHPVVQQALQNAGVDAESSMTGKDVYAALVRNAYDNPQNYPNFLGYTQSPSVLAASDLHNAGVPGIRYLDQGSRGEGQGTSNYVVFDPATVDILKKYGIAGLGIGAGAAASQANSMQTAAPAQ